MDCLVTAVLLMMFGSVAGKGNVEIPEQPSGWDRIFAIHAKSSSLEEAHQLCQPKGTPGPGAVATLAHLGSVALGLGEGEHPCGLLRDGTFGKTTLTKVPASKEVKYDAKKCDQQEEDTIYCVDLTLTSVLGIA